MDIALVAGEQSGDVLGAGLISALKAHYPHARFIGIGGERMQAQGFESLVPLEKLSVMGLVEVLRHLPELIGVRKTLVTQFTTTLPAVFIGIDAPDFNLGLAKLLRAKGIPTVQYVSPQIWAWRRWRVAKIGRAIDLILTLFPFEAEFYQAHQVPVRYVGHPLADEIPFLHIDAIAARQTLGINADGLLLALLPGSRMIEVEALASLFIATAAWLSQQRPQLHIVMPAATPAIQQRLQALLAVSETKLQVTLLQGQARAAISAADVVLSASGTATLETLLLKKPLVVAHRMKPISAWLARRLVRIPHFALPNLLAGRSLVPEFFQNDARVDKLGPALLALLDDEERRTGLVTEFMAIHRQLRCNASVSAAAAVSDLLKLRDTSTL